MQVSVESTGNLGRRMTVELPPERVDEEFGKRLAAMSKSVRLKGFRPGKAPLKVVKQQYGQRVMEEVLGELTRQSYRDAIAQHKLRPASGPSIQPHTMGEHQGLKYVAEFEILPEFQLAEFSDMEIIRPSAEISESDVDNMIESLRKQRATWQPVERESRQGDRMTIDYEGSLDGQPFANNSAKDFQIELGAGRWLEAFETQLTGLKAGETRAFDVEYPQRAKPAELAGKNVHFNVQVKSVSEPVLPAVDDVFAAQFGLNEGGVSALRAEVLSNLERELKLRLANVLRDRVMKALQEKHSVEVPQVLIHQELERLRWRTEQTGGAKMLATIPPETLEEEARRRSLLGLIVGEIVRGNKIRVDAVKLRENIQTAASSYEDPKRVAEFYYSDSQARASMEATTLEQQVVEWVIAKARLVEEKTSFDQLIGKTKS